ncbi:MAG TPA: ATP-binding protein [Chloroflexota bacterium]|nr:ATP-binding protein [Chloroflexota bacterium]
MTSLTVIGVLDAVLEQARALTEADCALVQLDRFDPHPPLSRASDGDTAPMVALSRLLQRNRRARQVLLAAAGPVSPTELARDLSAIPAEIGDLVSICAAPIPSNVGQLGIVVVARASDPPFTSQHYEALSAFLQRATLAIQNARLYEQLQAQLEELRSLHDQVVGAERLAALGQLAAKIAHELNNPLASIHMYNSLLLEGPMDESEQRKVGEGVQEQVERAKQVVMEILDYSRPRAPHRELLNLNDAVRHGLRLVQHAARPAHVTLVEAYADDVPSVLVDRGHMAQIVTNLTLNAIQAMPSGGTLTISTGAENGEVFFRFQDTGVGIPLSQQQRIFDAFFTTKAPGQGTGLGLAVCRTLVAQHHGRITVESEPGSGSAFTVWLPRATVEEEMVAGSNPR